MGSLVMSFVFKTRLLSKSSQGFSKPVALLLPTNVLRFLSHEAQSLELVESLVSAMVSWAGAIQQYLRQQACFLLSWRHGIIDCLLFIHSFIQCMFFLHSLWYLAAVDIFIPPPPLAPLPPPTHTSAYTRISPPTHTHTYAHTHAQVL